MIIGVLLAAAIVCFIAEYKKRYSDGGWAICGSIVLVFVFAALLGTRINSYVGVMELEAYYYANAQVMDNAIVDATNATLPFPLVESLEQLQLANLGHSSKIVEGIYAKRDADMEYNENLAYYNGFRDLNWLFFPMFCFPDTACTYLP